MNTIVIICNDPRIMLVKEALQPLLIAKIGIVPDFDTGLKEIFEKRPLVVFIQDEIAGVRGDTVTRHIRALLQANSPRFIQVEHTPPGAGMPDSFGNGINLNLPDEALVSLFKEHLEQVSGICWKEDAVKPATSELPVPAPQSGADDAPFFFSSPDEPAVPVEPLEGRFSPLPAEIPDLPLATPPGIPGSARERVPPVTGAGDAYGELSFLPEGEPVSSPVLAPPGPLPEPLPPGEPPPLPGRTAEPQPPSPQPVPESAGMEAISFGEPPFPVAPADPPRRSKLALLIGGVLVALLCGVLFSRFSPNPSPPSAVKPQGGSAPPQRAAPVMAPRERPPAPKGVKKKLPSFIPQEGFDPTYGSVNPGWERYVSPHHEYLIYSENGKTRALQVIALRQNSIESPLVSSILRELFGDATCVIRSRTRRSGYLIEGGTAATGAEVLFYKKKGTGETRGVVISLP